MTKSELQEKLAAGETLENLFRLSPGQEGLIYKAEGFSLGQEIIYIPDLSVHDLSFFHPAADREEIEDILSLCCTGDDFLEVCANDYQKAKKLFHYCDWQGPSAAVDEVADEPVESNPALDALMQKLDDCYAGYKEQWAALPSGDVDALIDAAYEIVSVRDTYEHLLENGDLEPEDAALLLGCEDPLGVAAAKWRNRIGDMSDFSFALDDALSDLKKQRDAKQGERPSTLQKLREKSAEAQQHKPGHDKSTKKEAR